jgi:hypothetical protein
VRTVGEIGVPVALRDGSRHDPLGAAIGPDGGLYVTL